MNGEYYNAIGNTPFLDIVTLALSNLLHCSTEKVGFFHWLWSLQFSTPIVQ